MATKSNDIKSKLQAQGATVIDGKSANIVADNIEAFKALLCSPELRNRVAELFPCAFADGELQMDALLQSMGQYADNVEDHESYPISWRGKAEAEKRAQTMTTATLRPCIEESVGKDGQDGAFDSQNLYIEGDNLEVLKVLERSYAGQIKMIYIDPPYNTGNDFIYNDKYADGIQTYLEYTKQKDDKGNDKSTKKETSGASHSNWLSMMYPRLEYAKRLLSDDGVIFISIDDNEQANLKKLCDMVFGETRRINIISIKMSEASGVKMAHTNKRLPKLKEYVVVYSKSDNIFINPIKTPKLTWDDEYKTIITNISDESLSYIKSVINGEEEADNETINRCNAILSKANYKSLSKIYYEFKIESQEDKIKYNYKNSHKIFQTVSFGGGASQKIIDSKNKANNEIFFIHKSSEGKCYLIKGDFDQTKKKPRMQVLFASEYLDISPGDFWSDIKTTGLDNEGDVPFKNGKKPLKLLKRLIELIPNDCTILDFFSGSATTAEAMFQMNVDGENRKFILVQLPEKIEISKDSDKQARKIAQESINFLESISKPHNIAEIGKERIRRAGKVIKEEHPEANIDIGFKVFKLDSSNLKKWDDKPAKDAKEVENRLLGAQDMMVPGRSHLDVVYEYMLKYGLTLDWPVECVKVYNKDVYVVAGGMFMVCLDHDLDKEWAKELVQLKKKLDPADWRVLVADESFGNETNTRDNNAQNIFHTLCDAGLAPVNFIIA